MKKLFLLNLILLPAFLLIAHPAKADNSVVLSLDLSVKAVNVGDSFTASVSVDPQGAKIDTIRLNIGYPPGLLELINAAKDQDYNYTAGGNVFDKTAGMFSYGAGIAGGTDQAGKFLSLKFKAVALGDAIITIKDDSKVLANGQNLLSSDRPVESKIIITDTDLAVLGAESLPDGSLVRGSNARVYVVVNGRKKHIMNLTELARFQGQTINKVSDEALSLYSDIAQPLWVNNYAPGILLRNTADKKIYAVTNAGKLYISSLAELAKFRKQPIAEPGEAVLASYPTFAVAAPQVKAAITDNSLVRDSQTGKIYAYTSGQLTHIKTLDELRTLFSGRAIKDVTAEEIKKMSMQGIKD